VSDLLEVFLRDNPARSGSAAIKSQKIRPGFFQLEAYMRRVGGFHRRHPLLHYLVRGAAIPLERELDVLGGYRFAVMEFCAFAESKVVAETVLGGRPRLGE